MPSQGTGMISINAEKTFIHDAIARHDITHMGLCVGGAIKVSRGFRVSTVSREAGEQREREPHRRQ